MSTGPRTQAAFFRGNQSKVEHDASRSALCYLFQEVSKLASPYQNGFPDTRPPSKRFNDASRNNAVEGKKDSHSFQTATTSYQRSLSCMLPCDQVRKVKEESHGSKATTLAEPPYECNSPWKVLSLINLHCERLLHLRDKEEMDPSSASSTTKTGNSTAKWSTAEPDLTLRPPLLFCGRKEITASVGPTDDVMGNSTRDGFKLRCCVKDSEVGCRVHLQTAVKTDIIGPELLEDNAKASLQPQHRYKMDVKLSVNRQLEWGQELTKACSSTQQDILDVCFSGNALSQTHTPKACPNTQLIFNSNNKAYSALSKPALTLDHNANLTLPTEALCDTPLPAVSSALPSSQSASLIFSTSENCLSLSKQDDKITAPKPECAHAPTEENSPLVSQLKPSSCNVSSTTPKSEFWTVQKAEIGLPSSHQWKTKTPRKQPHPCRSADIQDPGFQGVTFRMDTELDDSRKQCRLLITSKYSNELCKSVRKPRLRTRTSQKSHKTSSSEEENDLTANVLKDKVCASCCTKKTPMWRDAEDGTPLCNACGIRYKKYRVRCVNCWHIPRKEGNSISCCLKCGNFVRLTSAQRKRTT